MLLSNLTASANALKVQLYPYPKLKSIRIFLEYFKIQILIDSDIFQISLSYDFFSGLWLGLRETDW